MKVAVVVCLGVLAAVTLPCTVGAQSSDPSVRECFRRNDHPDDSGDWDARARARQAWIEVCRKAVAIDPSNGSLQKVFARALSSEGQRAEAIAIWRTLAKTDDAEANYELYEVYKSYYRSDVIKPQLVKREEAERSLRKAAELGHPYSMWILAVLLDRGSTVKRDPAGAIAWAERAMTKPPKDTSVADIEVRLGHFLAKSQAPEQRTRGIAVLERYAAGRGRGDAKAYLAIAVRGSDPGRARKLLDEGLRNAPGHVIPTLADMLIKGEGGPKDEKRGLSLLQGRMASDVGAVKGALGRLYLEGRLVPRDVAEAAKLIRLEAVWSLDANRQLLELLASNPTVSLVNPGGFLYDATEAAELDEPGAITALINLKLSQSAQFADRTGGCALAARYAKDGNAAAAERFKACT